jgi:uncharacterized iron-regulated membrane protein
MSTANVTTSPQPAAAHGTVTELVSGIVDDAQRLLKQQMEMVRAEFKEDLRRTKQVGMAFGIGITLLGLAGVMLAITCVYLLQELAPTLPVWATWAIVTGTVMVLGGAALLIGNRILASYNPLPDKSFNALQENVSWVANPPR